MDSPESGDPRGGRTARPGVGTSSRSRPADRRRPLTPLPKAEPWELPPETPAGPAVVALGGGRGLATVLTSVRHYAGSVTAVVSVADDGGSSGRLRKVHDVPAPGDLRRCIAALAASDNLWREAFEHRFRGGELDGHAFGNLVIVGLTEVLGDFGRALEEACRLLDCAGRVLPATSDPVVLAADTDGGGGPVEGQVAVANSHERIRRVRIVPEDAKAHEDAVTAIELADQVVLAPGSLFTSLLPVVCVPGIRKALGEARGKVVQVCNLRPQVPETQGLDATEHLRAVLGHGGRVDVFLYQQDGWLGADETAVRDLGVTPVAAEVAAAGGESHDPALLARALADLA
ncbi:MAG: gluconeogenesis factor YvcK family protein [Acidimicrobiia bacterium]